MRLVVLLLLSLPVLMNSLVALASGPIAHFERLSYQDDVSMDSINAIVQDNNGFLWFGGRDGLNRYDGYAFKIYRHDPQNTQSIAHNYINTLFQDSKGILWVGTFDGLSKFDADIDRFVHFKHQSSDPHSLSHNTVQSIHEDIKGGLWVGTRGGLNKYNSDTGQFVQYKHEVSNPHSLSHDNVSSIHEDKSGVLWVATVGGGLNKFDAQQQNFEHFRHQQSNGHSLSDDNILTIKAAVTGELWVGTKNGLNKFNAQTGRFIRFVHQSSNRHSLSNNTVNGIAVDGKGGLWVATDDGVNHFDPQTPKFVHYNHQPTQPDSLTHDRTMAVYVDATGILWIGTRGKGVNKYNVKRERFKHFGHLSSDLYSLSHNNVNTLYEDSKGQLWVGTADGLNKYEADSKRFVHYRHEASNPHSLSGNAISAIFADSTGTLWVGTGRSGLNRYDPKTERFKHFRHAKNDLNSLSDDFIWSIHEDANGTLWVGTMSGLNRLDRQNQRFERFIHHPMDPTSLSSNRISTLYHDKKNTLWVGTLDGGLNRYNGQENSFTHYRHLESKPDSLGHDLVTALYEDSSGTLWVGTYGGGLNRLDSKTGRFKIYRQKDGLANDMVYGILADSKGLLWISTNNGISQFDPKAESFKSYTPQDGLQHNEFNYGAFYQSVSGEMFFGGINGFNRFFPEQIEDDKQEFGVALTDFLLFNQTVPIRTKKETRDGFFTLEKAIHALDSLTLTHQENFISFEFAALQFNKPMKNHYAYQLQGWDQDWVFTNAKNRRATYTNIPTGDYKLRIKASNADGYWHEKADTLTVRVLPPPWQTWWAYTLYTLVLLSLVSVAFYVRLQRTKVRNAYALNRQLQQVDKLKDEFLANTSHELRTPLNGIIGLAESLIDGATGPLSDKTNANLAMVVSSGKRLANLVNDILDFSSLKNANLNLQTKAVDLHSMVDVVLTLSRGLLGDKSLALINDVGEDLPAVQADEDRLQQILHNLVGNAIKFTETGSVTVSAKEQQGQINIGVSDTGIGIEENQFANIFRSFEQVDGSTARTVSGTGLGLTVSQQLVALHGGQIKLTSTVGEGSLFSFLLPLADEKAPIKPVAERRVSRIHFLGQDRRMDPLPIVHSETIGRDFRILLVDDEPVNRQVLTNHLSLQNYQLVEASGGEQALQAIEKNGPFDLILLDIMMPKMSGYEVCKQLRFNHSVNDLPVIFLTAKNQVADLVQSFTVGANDYLSKPFSKHELLSRVETHLKLLDINRNLEQKVTERSTKLVESAKMTSLGTLTSGVAHEINNPTNFVHVSTQNLQVDLAKFQRFIIELAGDDADEEILESFKQQFKPLYQHLATIKDGTERIKTIVQDLRVFTQLDAADQKTVVLTDCLQSTLNLVRTKNDGVARFEIEFKAAPQLMCYPAQLNQVFMNVIDNGCDAIRAKRRQQGVDAPGFIVIGCQLRDVGTDKWIEITVKDNGCGMNEKTKSKLFEPFFTTKTVGEGTGLGLSISYGIVQKHGGELTVESKLGAGATFKIALPINGNKAVNAQ